VLRGGHSQLVLFERAELARVAHKVRVKCRHDEQLIR
jgi:hypothetical protein